MKLPGMQHRTQEEHFNFGLMSGVVRLVGRAVFCQPVPSLLSIPSRIKLDLIFFRYAGITGTPWQMIDLAVLVTDDLKV